jgi:hypothetical protein
LETYQHRLSRMTERNASQKLGRGKLRPNFGWRIGTCQRL